jgi:hypothetical protein
MDTYLDANLTDPERETVFCKKGQWTSNVGVTMRQAMSRTQEWRLGTVIPSWARGVIYIRPSDETLCRRAVSRDVHPIDVLNMANWLDHAVHTARTCGLDTVVWSKS